MYSIILQESLKKNMFCHKENNWQVFEKQRFPPNFNGPSCFNKNFNHKDHFPKKIALPIIFHMPPWWPMYLDLGLSNSSFCAGLFSTVSAQTGLNWFLLSIQTAKSSTKKNIYVTVFKIFGPNISSSYEMMMSTALRTHKGRHRC